MLLQILSWQGGEATCHTLCRHTRSWIEDSKKSMLLTDYLSKEMSVSEWDIALSLSISRSTPTTTIYLYTCTHTHKRQPGTTHTACGVNRDIERPSALRHTNSVLLYFLRLVDQLLIPNVSRLTARRKKKRPPWSRRRHCRVSVKRLAMSSPTSPCVENVWIGMFI